MATTTPSTIPTQIPSPNQNQTKGFSSESQTHQKPHKLCKSPQTGWSMPSQSSDDEGETFFVDQKKLVKLRSWFERLHGAPVEKVGPRRSPSSAAAPALGPDDGAAAAADLFKLFVVVRGKGGREAVTRRGLWGSVAAELGLGLELSAAVKLVYAKHLDAFERWVDRGVDVVRELRLMDGGDGPVSRKRKSSDDGAEEEEGGGGGEALGGVLGWVRGVARDPCDPSVGSLPEPCKWSDEAGLGFGGGGLVWKKVLLAREALFLKRNSDEQQKNQRMHPSMYADKTGSAYNLRQRQQTRRKLFNGKSGSQGPVGFESSPATSNLDRSMSGSEDQNEKSKTENSLESSIYRYSPSRIPTGPAYQAEVPDWTGKTCESDAKWLGTRVWPLDKVDHRFLVERDPMGKGRHESCGCQESGSLECVRFHIAEKRLRVKRELASAFYLWRFNRMGEEVKIFWTSEEEKKFKDTIASNLSAFGDSFWDQIFKAFPSKSRADLVSYYYNVYILRCRAHQNRFTPSEIDSDDEEFEPDSETNGDVGKETPESKKSTLLTPNKQLRK